MEGDEREREREEEGMNENVRNEFKPKFVPETGLN